ncbi:hypothetical protein A0J61_02503 [Choanephora cucurbitarum]|uniref:Uncharacterized protein n=1 Tax=Choanephora cucurbitarum TaxID=101091 RepID=A0A1C7NQA6_9FUNG|nr:hypothetical protein A0J61_02503 [Choanephora cucurbitarum]
MSIVYHGKKKKHHLTGVLNRTDAMKIANMSHSNLIWLINNERILNQVYLIYSDRPKYLSIPEEAQSSPSKTSFVENGDVWWYQV